MEASRTMNPAVANVIAALQLPDKRAWHSLFAPDVKLRYNGSSIDFHSLFQKALGLEKLARIDKTENNDRDVYGHFHSSRWDDLKTFFRFSVNEDGKISRLEIGRASY